MDTITVVSAAIEIEDKDGNTKKIEVEIPHFRKSEAHFYKVISENDCISICTPYEIPFGRGNRAIIQMAHAGLAWNSQDSMECSENEYKEAFEQTVQFLNK